jgi:menaquinol-cytochrome c reductase cytochrome b/c subunit
MVRPTASFLLVALLAGCSGGGGSNEPTRLDLPGDRSSRGAQLVGSSGCPGCHKIGGSGNDGPGPNLTHVGERMPASAIARVLVAPTPPMPSFKRMPQADREAIADYLSSLR